MTWFNEQDNQDLPADYRSLTIAMSNLLQRYDYDLPPKVVYNIMSSDDPIIDAHSLTRAFDELSIEELIDGDQWPITNSAIVRQRRMDPVQGGIVDHYSLIADQRAHSIIDSLDGRIKNAVEYGPILSYVSYTYSQPNVSLENVSDVPDDNIHILADNENLWDIGRQYNVPVASLMAENEIEDPRHVKVGTEIYIPERPHKPATKEIKYELFIPARPMHVAREGGAKKWSYGGITKWEDLYSTGRVYPDGLNLNIVAVAHVPIGNETAAYYLDTVSLGDYATTGTVRYTTGFNWKHLEEGHVEGGTPPVPEATIEAVVADAMAEEDRPDVIEENKEEVITPSLPLSYKTTFQFLNDEKRSEYYTFREHVEVVEMDGRLPTKHMGPADSMRVIGTFEREGITYARAAVPKYWYGVPMDKITSEDSLYNTDIDLPTRLAMRGHLTAAEKRMVIMAKTAAGYTKFIGRFIKK